MRILLASLLVLLPCFWHTHIQAGDLGSHMYNVWLAQLIEQGRAPSLFLHPVLTNVLFDVWASLLVGWTGFQWGERLAVSTAVLTLFWGAFAWIRTAGKTNPWPVAPLLAMFAYGWVFHVGFMNFYWSIGFCLFGLAWSRHESAWGRRLWWLALLPAATAHMLPVGWAVGLWLYGEALRRTVVRWQLWLLGGGVFAIAGVGAFIRMRYRYEWAAEQILGMLGIDQLFLIVPWYLILAAGFLAVWALGLLWTLDGMSLEEFTRKPQVHYLVLTAVSVFLIPWAIEFPSFSSPLSFIAQRMSLAVAILMCGVLALSNRPRQVFGLSLALSVVFFSLIYKDAAPLDEYENKLYEAVRTLPAGVRVVAPYSRDPARAFLYGHIVDRACIGHCFSYANYEAATTQFRVRAYGPNPMVAHENSTSIALQMGDYTVTADEAPLHYFKWDPGTKTFSVRVLREGDRF